MGSDIFIFDKSDIFNEVESEIVCYANSDIVFASKYSCGKIYKVKARRERAYRVVRERASRQYFDALYNQTGVAE